MDWSTPQSAQAEASSLSISSVVVPDGATALLVAVTTCSVGGEAVTGISWNGQVLTQLDQCLLGGSQDGRPPVRTETWWLPSPAAGTADVLVSLTGTTKAIATAAVASGGSQGCYWSTDQVGDKVKESQVPAQRQAGGDLVEAISVWGTEGIVPAQGESELVKSAFQDGSFLQQLVRVPCPETNNNPQSFVLSSTSSWALNVVGVS